MLACRRKECNPTCNLCENSVSLRYVAKCIDRMEELDEMLPSSEDERLIALANMIRDTIDLVRERPIAA